MKRHNTTAVALSTVTFVAAVAVSWMVLFFLPLSSARIGLATGCILGGIALATAVYAVVVRLHDRRRLRVAAVSVVVLLSLLPFGSVLAQRITYWRFGFTVYGAIPIPALDITINRNGILWFRPKSHQITQEELAALVTDDVEVVVVGIGWDSIAQLTDEAERMAEAIDLRVLSTPDAFTLYNRLRSEGRIVVLLAHSTC